MDLLLADEDFMRALNTINSRLYVREFKKHLEENMDNNQQFSLEAALTQVRKEASERPEWWKIPVGTFRVVILKNPNAFMGKSLSGEPQERLAMEVSIFDKARGEPVSSRPMILAANKDSRPESLYFQILLAAQENGGSFQNLSFDLIVKQKGRGKDFTIPSIAHLVAQEVARAKAPASSFPSQEAGQ